MIQEELFEKWIQTWSEEKFGGNPLFVGRALLSSYSDPKRFYHNQVHLANCLHQWGIFRETMPFASDTRLAIWFHDAIYIPQNEDNEERSADWAGSVLRPYLTEKNLNRVISLILATKHNGTGTDDAEWILDIDLSILGSNWDVFLSYEEGIRKEFSYLKPEQYREGRKKVLSSLLSRSPNIYSTPNFRSLLEEKAEVNLKKLLERI